MKRAARARGGGEGGKYGCATTAQLRPGADAETRVVEELLSVPRGAHASAVVTDEVADALRAAGVPSEAERILGEAEGTPAGEVLRFFREGFGRLSTSARVVVRNLGYDPAFGGTG